MTTSRSSILRSALGLLSLRWIAMQLALGFVVFLLFVVWLRVPDSSAVSIVASVLLGLILIALVGGGEAYMVQRLSGQATSRRRILLGGVAILVGFALAVGWSAVLDHVAENDSLWAGYLNSRFPHGLRNVFSYAHIYEWFTWLWTLLGWLGQGFSAAVVIAVILSDEPIRAARRVLRSMTFWISFLVGSALFGSIFGWISNWTPGHGLLVESVSLVARSMILALIEGALASLLLAIAVAATQRSKMLDGTSAESQPRTVDTP